MKFNKFKTDYGCLHLNFYLIFASISLTLLELLYVFSKLFLPVIQTQAHSLVTNSWVPGSQTVGKAEIKNDNSLQVAPHGSDISELCF